MNNRLTITAGIAAAAASTSLAPLISGVGWFFAGLGAIIVVAAVGTAARQRALRALPAVICLLCALVALVLYLNLVFSGKASFLRVLPTPRSLAQLWQSAVTGLRDTHRYATPAPEVAAIELLAAGGIGLAAAVTDLLAVRLRRCALAGLPLLVLFSVPIATDAGKDTRESAVLFCIGMAGYLALLNADGRDRLRLWGRLVTPWNAGRASEPGDEPGTGPSSRALAASGRRIGLAAVTLAMVVPLLVPGLQAHKWFHGSGGSGTGPGAGPDAGANVRVNPLVQMTSDLRQARSTPVLRYHTTDAHPQYLVEYVLNRMSATSATWVPAGQFVQASAGNPLPQVPGLVSGSWPQVRTTVQVQATALLGDSYLPVPYAPRLLSVSKGSLLVNKSTLMVYSPLTSLAGTSYTVTSVDVAPTSPAQFAGSAARPAGMASYLSVPAPLQSLRPLAAQIAGNARTPYAQAQALQAWFRSGRFSYNVNAKEPDNAGALPDFLEHTRSGYCQQFAFAMTVLARLLGIPARIAVGFDAGSSLGHGNYQVDTGDAHAWTQLYFTGLGWLTWDATPPGTATGQVNVAPPSYTLGPQPGGPGVSPGGSLTHSTLRGIPKNISQPGGFRGRQGVSPGKAAGNTVVSHPGSSLPISLIVLAVLLAAALLTPRTARSLTRRRRWMTGRDEAGRAHAAWAEMLDDLTDYGIGHGPAETPRAVARRITTQQHLAGPARAALGRIAEAEERASYAPEPAASAGLPADVIVVRDALSALVTRSARWQARLFPASSVERLRRVLAHALDAFGWLEIALGRLASRLPRPRADQG